MEVGSPVAVNVPLIVVLPPKAIAFVTPDKGVNVTFAAVIGFVNVNAPAPVKTMLLYAVPVPLIVTLLPVNVNVAVLAVKVKFEIAKFHAVLDAVRVTDDAPKVRVREFVEVVEMNEPQEHVWPFVLSVPCVRVTTPVTVKAVVFSHVPVNPVLIVQVVQLGLIEIVNVPVPECVSKVTASVAAGDAAVAVPPDVVERTSVEPFIVVPFVVTTNHDVAMRKPNAAAMPASFPFCGLKNLWT